MPTTGVMPRRICERNAFNVGCIALGYLTHSKSPLLHDGIAGHVRERCGNDDGCFRLEAIVNDFPNHR